MVGGCKRGCVVGGSGGELVNLSPYVGVEHRIILAANTQCHICIPLYTVFPSVIFNSVVGTNQAQVSGQKFQDTQLLLQASANCNVETNHNTYIFFNSNLFW